LTPTNPKALTFDFVKGQKPVGNAVRDAACYSLYSLVRTTKSIPPLDIQQIAIHLICVATLDPSTTIRRAASAAFQELVGRQVVGSIPCGITVLSMMDYHAVGSRRGGFEVAGEVALVDKGYRGGIVEWCISRGVGHWEGKGREGIAKVLGRIFSHGRDGIIDTLQQLVWNLE
jgi:tubulin-specific chaperone D